jgi:ribokinase
MEGRDPPEAARFAVAASTAAVRAYGAQPSYPDRNAVMALMPGQEERSSS